MIEDIFYKEVYWNYNQDGNHEVFHNVIYVKDSPKYRLMELVRFCGLGLRTLVSKEASVQRVEKGRYPAWLGDIHFSFTFTVANPINLETCCCYTFRISLNCTETRDQFAWCRRRKVVHGNGWDNSNSLSRPLFSLINNFKLR